MKYYQLWQLTLLLFLAMACSKDTDEQQSLSEPSVRIAQNQFDNSHLGVYKGLFTTNDGLTRGSVELTLTPNNEGIAKITLSSGEQIELKSPRVKLTVDNNLSNLRFSSEGLSSTNATLEFSVHGDGTNPSISNVSFDTKASDILIAKNLSRAPLTPITGTYVRTSGTGGFPITGRTWNILSIGAGDAQNFAIQIAYGNRVYTSPSENNEQSDCVSGGGLTTCAVNGTVQILGYEVSWTGTHAYSLGTLQSCSSASGTWTAPSYGNSAGTFTSDVDASDCVEPIEEVVIGTQTWMLKNLDVEHYRNGDPIPQVQDPTEWANLTTGAWCYYNNDPANGEIYGKLYNDYAVIDPRGLAPEGWHIPAQFEWSTLFQHLGGNNVAGGKMKSTSLWEAPNTGATNESGFTALPGGFRDTQGFFLTLSRYATFHSAINSSQSPTTLLWIEGAVNFINVPGRSVRCVKD